LNRPKQKWVVMVNEDCPCQFRHNLVDPAKSVLKLCTYHEKVRVRWGQWSSRPKPLEAPPSKPLPFEAPDDDTAEA